MSDAAAIAKVIARWRADPLAYVIECIGQDGRDPEHTIEPWQREALIALRTEPRLAIRSGHGVGKTTLLAWIIHWFGDTRNDAKIPITAPVASQLEIQLWSELRKWRSQKMNHSKLGYWLGEQMEIKGDEITWKNGNIAVARTARPDKPEALAGFHARCLLFIMDEASGIEELIFETALGSLSTPGAIQVMTGNPTRPQGYFFNAFHRNRAQWWTKRVSSEEVPRARGHIDDVIKTYGKDSNQYRVRVKGEFPTQSDDQLIALEDLEKCQARWGKIKPVRVQPIWGGDIGYRVDRSALAKRRGNAMIEPVKFWPRFADPLKFAYAIFEEWNKTPIAERPSSINLDILFEGASVSARCRELGMPAVGVNVSEAAFDPKYFNRRTELWCLSQIWSKEPDSIMPNEEGLTSEQRETMRQLLAELSAVLLLPPNSKGQTRVEPKDATKKRLGGLSTDLADAWNLTFATPAVHEGAQAFNSVGQADLDFDPMMI